MRLVARGDAAIAWPDRTKEWVNGGVNPTSLKIESDGSSQRLAENALAVDGKLSTQDGCLRFDSGSRDGFGQGNQFLAQGCKKGGNLLCGDAGLIVFQQGIVRAAFIS